MSKGNQHVARSFQLGAQACALLLERGEITTGELRRRLGVNRSTAQRYLRWLELIFPLQADPNWRSGTAQCRAFRLMNTHNTKGKEGPPPGGSGSTIERKASP